MGVGVDRTPGEKHSGDGVHLCITYNKRRSGRQLCCMVKMQLEFQPRKHNTASEAYHPANHLTRFIASRCLKHQALVAIHICTTSLYLSEAPVQAS
ncbi:unnamed protein product [Clonostachys rosea]|uniref:Uncharacterized protein n=1 Tax=Bionectria ochroleuca TaxID=29856 RepID=A0ABY6V1P9_BIOOC|nr:unnamed protein product [Clonostachys rosea]